MQAMDDGRNANWQEDLVGLGTLGHSGAAHGSWHGMAQSGTTDQGEIALAGQPAQACPAIGQKDAFRNLQ